MSRVSQPLKQSHGHSYVTMAVQVPVAPLRLHMDWARRNGTARQP